MRLKVPGLERPRGVGPELFELPLPDRRLLLIECAGSIAASRPRMARAVISGSAATRPSRAARCGSRFEGMHIRVLYVLVAWRCVARTSAVAAARDFAKTRGAISVGAAGAMASQRRPIRSPRSD